MLALGDWGLAYRGQTLVQRSGEWRAFKLAAASFRFNLRARCSMQA